MNKNENKQPQFVAGYWRNKTEKTKAQEQPLLAIVMMVSGLVLMAVVLWKATLVIGGAGLTLHSTYRVTRNRLDTLAHGMVVNYMGKRRIV